jgi:hypothetical protein
MFCLPRVAVAAAMVAHMVMAVLLTTVTVVAVVQVAYLL